VPKLSLTLLLAATATITLVVTVIAQDLLQADPGAFDSTPARISSAILGESREYLVSLPEGYDAEPGRRYPVLYVLDGSSQTAHAVETARLLARIGVIPPLIVVGIPAGETRNRDYTPPGMRLDTDVPDSPEGSADDFLAFVEEELIPRVEADLRTTRPRMLAGWSRGGLFAVYSQIAAPALFDGRFALSPALWRDEDRIVEALETALLAGSIDGGFLFTSLGGAESENMVAGFDHGLAVLERSAPPTLRWEATRSRGADHETNPVLSMPLALCAMFHPGGERTCGTVPFQP